MDNLNTHSIASLYATFPPQRARGSLNVWRSITRQNTELTALGRQCIAKNRIPNLTTLRSLLLSWASSRNSAQKGVDWQFSTSDARSRLKHLYPVVKF